MPEPPPLASATPPGFDLSRIHLLEASFLDCIVSTEIPETGFVPATVNEVSDLLAIPSFDMAARRIYYTLSLRVEASDGAGAPTGITGFFRVHFAFQVENLTDYTEEGAELDGPHPSADLMIMLGGVAYATTRGLLIGKTAGTPLNGFSLPLLSPQQLFYDSVAHLTDNDEPLVEQAPPKKKTAANRPAPKAKRV